MNIYERISSIESCDELYAIKQYLDDHIEFAKRRIENFRYRDYIDDYIYHIYFTDGRKSIQCKGKIAYEIFESDSAAQRIELKTKDLFPTIKYVLEKEKGAELTAPQRKEITSTAAACDFLIH